MRAPPSCTQTPKLKPNLSQDFGFVGTHRKRAQLMRPIHPYVSSVKLTLCDTPEEQEQSKLLIAELMTNEVAAAKIESFTIEYFCIIDGVRESRSGDSLSLFVELIDRGGGYLQALNHIKQVLFCIARSQISDTVGQVGFYDRCASAVVDFPGRTLPEPQT